MVPIEIDTVYESGMYSAAISISGKRFTELSQIRHANFDQRYYPYIRVSLYRVIISWTSLTVISKNKDTF